ncbi:MAG: hypothetical protein HY644_02230 [Acidobacteria bacterium]|nr:hypothetical protein [Acidobacteriota bacterium]
MKTAVVVGLNAVIVAVTEEVPRILTVKKPVRLSAALGRGNSPAGNQLMLEALPFGLLNPTSDSTLDKALRRLVGEQTGLELGYVEQLYTFGDRYRDPREIQGGSRMVSVAYLALVREGKPSGVGQARWTDWYWFFPWEDWRAGRPAAIDQAIAPVLFRWARGAANPAISRQRQERIDIIFGLGGVPWDGERVLERYELLYEVGLMPEAGCDRAQTGSAQRRSRRNARNRYRTPSEPAYLGHPMTLDHRRILAAALGRLRGKLKYRPLVFELLPPTFTLLQLQRIVEALAGVRLHKQNLRRLVAKGGLVEGTGKMDTQTGGRPAELFRFRREVLRERPAPGVGLPGTASG